MGVIRVIVVGAGILGLAAARQITFEHPGATVVVLEKEDAVAAHQTGHNSGVVHAGLYYAPGSLKARLCRRGATELERFCHERDIPYDRCGKLVIATEQTELPRLKEIERRAHANGVPGIRMIGTDEIAAIEPHACGIAAVHSPATAIVDYRAVAEALADEVAKRGGKVRLGIQVDEVRDDGGEVRVKTVGGLELTADRALVCAGLQSDQLAQASGQPPEPRIVPFRGEYWQLRPGREDLVRGLIYPVPDPALPFLGVHLTKRIDGAVLVGPNAVLALAREGYRWRTVRVGDLSRALAWPGTRKLFAQHWRVGIDEVGRSFSRRRFVAAARRYVPELRAQDVIRSTAGVRAQAVDRDGAMVDDFRIGVTERTVWVRNAPSPAATSSLAIGEELVRRLGL